MYIAAYEVLTPMVQRHPTGAVFADMASDEPDGVPDGMKVDSEGRCVQYRTGRLLGF